MSIIRQLIRFAKALPAAMRKALRISNAEHWESSESLHDDWEGRTELLARLINPGESVIEFGSGKQALRKYLGRGTAYTPSDIVNRGLPTLVCDLNKPLPVLSRHDVAVFSGVLEYVIDLPLLMQRLGTTVNAVVCSYCVTDNFKSTLGRRAIGWMNDYSDQGLIQAFARAGFVCVRKSNYQQQPLYRFEQNSRPSSSPLP